MRRLLFHLSLVAAIAGVSSMLPAAAGSKKSKWADSPLAAEQQAQMTKATKAMRSGKYERAEGYVLQTLDSSSDVAKCLAIADATEGTAYPMLEARRKCLNKALGLCSTREDFILVALRARKYQFFEVTRACVTALIKNARTVSDLYDLAHKSQEVALNDISHLAMEKAYTGIKTVPDAVRFATEAKSLGMEDLQRKTVKDLIDDEDDTRNLCELLLQIEPILQRDQLRYLLKKALDKATSVGHMEDIRDLSRRFNEPDIANRAAFFARKGRLMQEQKDAAGGANSADRFGPSGAAAPGQTQGSGF
jgi:hypothetical protein